MVVIKRYPNRKLYDTEAKQYITLAGVAELVHQGYEIKVVDNATGEDLTAFTLAQIILGQERKQERNRDGLLTHSFLTDLIRSRGERISAFKTSLRPPVHFGPQFDEEIKLRLQNLINAGQLSEKEANQLIDKLLSSAAVQNSESKLNQDIESFFARNWLATREDLQRLYNQLDDLSKKLAEISDKYL
jgi:polyhydroxyalkanoate synthesis repressor PhaR